MSAGSNRLPLSGVPARNPRYLNSTAAWVAVVALASLWLRAAYPPMGVWAPHDDWLFIRLAGNLGKGEWLGAYDQLSHAKGMFYSLFLLINQWTGLPLKLSEHAVYLLASGFAAAVFAHLSGHRRLLLPLFVILALSPIAWMAVQARVVRESIYLSQGLALFFLTALYWRNADAKPLAGVFLGLLAGAYWLTREEGIWLLPALAVLIAPSLLGGWAYTSGLGLRDRAAAWSRAQTRLWAPVLAAFALVLVTVDTLNFSHYGVFRDNDFRNGPFNRAYGALSRIRHDHWKRYVVFPRDARQRAYSVSPAARELQPHYEAMGTFWIKASQGYRPPWGCAATPAACNDEILSAWFVWALRDAVAAAGYYRSAPIADAFYERLADEVDTACADKTIPCHAPRSGMHPVWRDHYLADTLRASAAVFATLTGFSGGKVGVRPSTLTAEQASVFEHMTNSRPSGPAAAGALTSDTVAGLDGLRLAMTRSIAAFFAFASPWLFALAVFGYLVLLLAWAKLKSAGVTTYSVAILTALLVAILSRVGLLGYLEATSIPSNNMLYLSPAIPFYLLFVGASLLLCGMAIARVANVKTRALG